MYCWRMGFPVGDPKRMPFDLSAQLRQQDGAKAIYSCAGNGINFWTLGAVLVWALAAVRRGDGAADDVDGSASSSTSD